MGKQKSPRAPRARSQAASAVKEDVSAEESVQQIATAVSEGARQQMISEAAYYRAEKRGFAPGRDLEDWLAAETEITAYFLEQEPAAAELH